MPPPTVYRFEPNKKSNGQMQTWEEYLIFACAYFKLSVYDRTQALKDFRKYTSWGVDQACAGYIVLRESGLYAKMKADVARHRPHRADKNTSTV
jgi:hypothetical protein